MADQILRELEAAAQVVLAPPNLVNAVQRQSAEAVFLNFQKTQSPYDLCKDILETSVTDYVLFETAGVIKTALIREWPLLEKSHITFIRQYLLHYLISKPTLAPFVRERILQVIAIIIKRGSIDDLGEERNELLKEVEMLIMCGDLPKQLLGCSIISVLIEEYGTTVKSSDVGLTWEVHFVAKKQFEVSSLKRIFKFCVQALGELAEAELSESILPLIKHLLTISESVLTWYFIYGRLPRRLLGIFTLSSVTEKWSRLRLTSMWKNIMLDPLTIDLFFTLYWKVRSNPQLAHYARNCLVQLASVDGALMESKDVKFQYLTIYMQNFLKLISNIEIIDQEAIGIANIFERLIEVFCPTMYRLPEEMLILFMEQLIRKTCLFAEGASREESMCIEDCLYMEAFQIILNLWGSIILGTKHLPDEFYKQSSMQIFNIYLQLHLAPPDGMRGAGGKEVDNEEITDEKEDDKSKFKSQLMVIGILGAQVLEHSLPLLFRFIEDCTNKLKEQLSRLVGQHESFNNTDFKTIENIYEDLHWLILIAGHVLGMDADGENSSIPREVIRYSMEQAEQGQMDINVSLQLLVSPQSNIENINGAEQSCDHVIRLVAAVFRLSEVSKMAIDFNATQHLSPELCSNIVWFLQRWAADYLIIDEKCYMTISVTLLRAFGEESPCCQWIYNFIIEKIECYIKVFKGEAALMEETINLLHTLVNTNAKSSFIMQCERFGNLVELATKNDELPLVVKRGLMRAIVEAGTSLSDEKRLQQYFNQILQPIHNRFKDTVCHENFPRTFHQEQIQLQIINILESLIGTVMGVKKNSIVIFAQYIDITILNDLPRLFNLYYNYQPIVQLILELYYTICKYMYYPVHINTQNFLKSTMHMIQAYAGCKRNRLTVDATAEEDAVQDLLQLMKLFRILLNEEIDYQSALSETESNQNLELSPAEVAFYGIHNIMPMLTLDLLKLPTLCSQYYNMLEYACTVKPDKICSLPAELLQQFMISVELGLCTFGQEVSSPCCGIIQMITKHIHSEMTKGKPRNDLMSPFLNLLITLIVTHRINSDNVCSTNLALYYLISCYRERYEQLIPTIISQQTDTRNAQRLADAFNALAEGIRFDGSIDYRIKFRDNFEQFIVDIQGFLIVK